jgi:hypothetical protein
VRLHRGQIVGSGLGHGLAPAVISAISSW